MISRNQFESLLQFINFSKDEENDPNNRLFKIIRIIDIQMIIITSRLHPEYIHYYNPNESLTPSQD